MTPDTLSAITETVTHFPDSIRVILENRQSQTPFWETIPFWSIIITLLAVSVGPWLQRKIAREQISTQLKVHEDNLKAESRRHKDRLKADLIVKHRQLWMSELQEDIAEFVGLHRMWVIESMFRGNHRVVEYRDLEIVQKMRVLHASIDLKLDRSKPSHKNLSDALSLMVTTSAKKPIKKPEEAIDTKDAHYYFVEVTALTGIVINEEWREVVELMSLEDGKD